MGKEKLNLRRNLYPKQKKQKAMGKTDYGKHDIEHGVCTMDGTTHKFPIGIHAIRICIDSLPKAGRQLLHGKRNPCFLRKRLQKKHDMTSIKAHVAYWDAEQQGWRTFLIENFMEWRPIVN